MEIQISELDSHEIQVQLIWCQTQSSLVSQSQAF